MTTNPFENPAPTGGELPLDQLNGSLVIVEPLSFEEGVTTRLGVKDAVKANVYAVDGPLAGSEFLGTLVFPLILISQLRPKIGKKVLGRIGQGQPKPSQSPPWIINDPTEQDVQQGVAFLNARQSQQFQPPAPQQQQWPAQQPTAQQHQQQSWQPAPGQVPGYRPAPQQPQPQYGQPPF